VLRQGETIYPSLAAELLRVAQGARSNIIKSSGASGVESFGEQTGVSEIRIGQMVAPTDANGTFWCISPSIALNATFQPGGFWTRAST